MNTSYYFSTKKKNANFDDNNNDADDSYADVDELNYENKLNLRPASEIISYDDEDDFNFVNETEVNADKDPFDLQTYASDDIRANLSDHLAQTSNNKLSYSSKSKDKNPLLNSNNNVSRVIANKLKGNVLRAVDELPSQFRNIFAEFPYFNVVQSKVFDDVVYNDTNLIISAPTSSGKTIILELAIVRLLIDVNYNRGRANTANFKIIYMAPLKAVCTEKYAEWTEKFSKLHNLNCIELTGDTDTDNENNFNLVKNAHIICTTPEKWDIMTRKWKNSHSIMSSIRLFLIDEIHVLGECSRGSTIEAVISRMKTLSFVNAANKSKIRFIAISATIPNIDDFATWLSTDMNRQSPAITYKLNESFRPVKLEKYVIGYYCGPTVSDYMFDVNLGYKIANVIENYSDEKPTLIFCSTRKNAMQSAQMLAKERKYFKSNEHIRKLSEIYLKFRDTKLALLIKENGIGFHHAGMDTNDRHLIEKLYLEGDLLILFCTSTLSIGVNLPAHLVIIKSTKCYSSNRSFVDYTTTQINQMIGRAGRPQFDDSAKAVIMTKQEDKHIYENLLNGNQEIESNLHHELIEHLNVEIVLKTIIDLNTAIKWLKSTFLYSRVFKNPTYYGINITEESMNEEETIQAKIDEYLCELCIRNLNELIEADFVEPCDLIENRDAKLRANRNAELMARYCLKFETMKLILNKLKYSPPLDPIDPDFTDVLRQPFVSLEDLLVTIALSKEFEDVTLRQNEKSILNKLNNDGKMPKSKSNQTSSDENQFIRYRIDSKIKNKAMKTYVLIQAQLGNLQLSDFSLNQDVYRILRVAQRISRCMLEYLIKCETKITTMTGESFVIIKCYETFLNVVILNKCLRSRMWPDSPHLFQQISKIGPTSSQLLIKAQINSFEQLTKLTTSEIEAILNKKKPFGDQVMRTLERLPKFSIEFRKKDTSRNSALVDVICRLKNYEFLKFCGDGGCLGLDHKLYFVLGDEKHTLLVYQHLNLGNFLSLIDGAWTRRVVLSANENGSSIYASIISLSIVGIDSNEVFKVFEWMETDSESDDQPAQKKLSKTTKLITKKANKPAKSSKLTATKPIPAKRKASICEIDNEYALSSDSSCDEKIKENKKPRKIISDHSNDSLNSNGLNEEEIKQTELIQKKPTPTTSKQQLINANKSLDYVKSTLLKFQEETKHKQRHINEYFKVNKPQYLKEQAPLKNQSNIRETNLSSYFSNKENVNMLSSEDYSTLKNNQQLNRVFKFKLREENQIEKSQANQKITSINQKFTPKNIPSNEKLINLISSSSSTLIKPLNNQKFENKIVNLKINKEDSIVTGKQINTCNLAGTLNEIFAKDSDSDDEKELLDYLDLQPNGALFNTNSIMSSKSSSIIKNDRSPRSKSNSNNLENYQYKSNRIKLKLSTTPNSDNSTSSKIQINKTSLSKTTVLSSSYQASLEDMTAANTRKNSSDYEIRPTSSRYFSSKNANSTVKTNNDSQNLVSKQIDYLVSKAKESIPNLVLLRQSKHLPKGDYLKQIENLD